MEKSPDGNEKVTQTKTLASKLEVNKPILISNIKTFVVLIISSEGELW